MKKFRGLLFVAFALGCALGITGYASFDPPEATVAGHISFSDGVSSPGELTLSAVKKPDGRIKGHLDLTYFDVELTGKIIALDVIPEGHPEFGDFAGAWFAFFEVTESNNPALVGTIGIVGGAPATDLFSAPSDWVYGPLTNSVSPTQLSGGPLAWWLGYVTSGLHTVTWEVVTGNIVAKLNPSN